MNNKTKDQVKEVAFYQTHYGELHFLMRELITLDCKVFILEQKKDSAKTTLPEGVNADAAKIWMSRSLRWDEEDDRELEYLHLLQEKYKERLDVINAEIESH